MESSTAPTAGSLIHEIATVARMDMQIVRVTSGHFRWEIRVTSAGGDGRSSVEATQVAEYHPGRRVHFLSPVDVGDEECFLSCSMEIVSAASLQATPSSG